MLEHCIIVLRYASKRMQQTVSDLSNNMHPVAALHHFIGHCDRRFDEGNELSIHADVNRQVREQARGG